MRRAGSLVVVGLLHVGALLAISVGLATQLMKPPPEPIVVDVAQPQAPKEVPPPPPPEQIKPPPPPTIPPPDIQIAAPATPPTNTITATTKPPPPADPMAGVTSASVARRANCQSDFYPALSARMHEQGTVGLSMIIGTDGVPKNIEVEKSSGKPRLDQASVECLKTWRYKPAMKDGQPIEIPGHPTITWALQ